MNRRATASNFIHHRLRSPLWHCYRRPRFSSRQGAGGKAGIARWQATVRWIAGFQYIGPANFRHAQAFGILGGGNATGPRASPSARRRRDDD
jgi:hypothetical protein